MMGWGDGWGAGGMFGAVHLAWWILLVVAVGLLARWAVAGARGSGRRGDDRALDILKERYARGEIDKAEFDARKRDLV